MNLRRLLENLPKMYDPSAVEQKWRKFWLEEGIYAFDSKSERDKLYTVDTPPPTVSGDLHIGHVFSYSHQDFIVRYKRMRGAKVFYPFGFDDNGLPTERLVERVKGVKATDLPREDFWRLCLEVSANQEEVFKDLWQDVGLSCDWNEVYSTIDERCRRISQRSFLDLYSKGHLYRKEAPTLWCVECNTAIAQAEVEDKEETSEFHTILFTANDGEPVSIATTRPELLPACVAVFYHPSDGRYTHLKGKTLITPHFNVHVPVLEDLKVNPEKGTGIVMCCTFGDTVDIEWWQDYSLQTRIAIDSAGTMNEQAKEFAGVPLRKARQAIVQRLREEGLLVATHGITHTVSAHERCGTPLEYLVNKQWFIKVLDKKTELIKVGEKIRWFPPHMFTRYKHWVENLKWDWCISRQRYFGVPFPIWYCEACEEVIPAPVEDLPVNPLSECPPADACPKCGGKGFKPEADVFDTWATSSLTPQINANWGEPNDRTERIFPMSLRPQAHDIIRTWAFYTIVKAYLHHGSIPWSDIVISGHALDSSRTKISKSKSETVNPKFIIGKYSADVVRYWAGQVKLGTDTFINLSDPTENLAVGKRLMTKIYNACKLSHLHLVGFSPYGLRADSHICHPVDRWLIGRLVDTIEKATSALEVYEFADALAVTENFFWSDFCDNYLELAKGRLYGDALALVDDSQKDSLQTSARFTLYLALEVILKLFAPIIPYITEETWNWYFRDFNEVKSIHLTRWPRKEDLEGGYDEESRQTGDALIEALTLVRKAKSELKVSIKKPAERVTLGFASPEKIDESVKIRLERVKNDLLATGNIKELLVVDKVIEEGIELDPPRLRAKLEI